ncbi:MAG TPA: hypothetical protein VFT37_12885 [Telluria sp.]|nr:hypothetical protein [Telluria sp.]
MDSIDDKRQELIRRAMAAGGPEPGTDPGSRRIEPWTQLSTHLCPLIGESGFTALHRRTMRMVSGRFPWLESTDSSTVEEMLAGLRSQLGAADSAHAGEANTALLQTFTKLLSGLIGEALTVRLLQAAWNDPVEKANAREQS